MQRSVTVGRLRATDAADSADASRLGADGGSDRQAASQLQPTTVDTATRAARTAPTSRSIR